MIEDIYTENDELIWRSNGSLCHVTLRGGTYIYDKNTVLVMNRSYSEIVVLDEHGNRTGSLNNTNNLCLMYLQKICHGKKQALKLCLTRSDTKDLTYT